MDNIREFLQQFSPSVSKELERIPRGLWRDAEELRLRVGYPALFVCGGKEYTVSGQALGKIDQNLLNNIINRFLNYSDYAHPQELRSGFIALPGGHRAGFCGQAVINQGSIATIREVTSINVRFAKEVPQAGRLLWPQLLDAYGRFGHTLIASPPGCGKTTLLRSLIRMLSDHGYNVSVCDERNEISGAGLGGFAFDLGRRTDVMTGCSKEEGMTMMLRSMGPQVICTDEVGTEEEVRALRRAVSAGVILLTTIHAGDLKDLAMGPLGKIIGEGTFFRIVFLSDRPSRGTVTGIWKREAMEVEPCR